MRSINKVILIGNLTRDPEMRQTPNGQTVTTFGIATNREWVTRNGEKKNSAEFHECVAWARLAEICNNYLRKGRLVYIEGYLKTRSWDTPEGVKKFKTEIVIQDMIMLEKKPEDEDYVPESKDDNDKDNEDNDKDNEDNDKDNEDNDKDNEDNDNDNEENKTENNKTNEKDTEKKSEYSSSDKEENPIDKDLGL